jgi:hypothetical protein
MDLMCKYSYELGSDWVVAAGLEEGFSQVKREARKSVKILSVAQAARTNSSSIYRWIALLNRPILLDGLES